MSINFDTHCDRTILSDKMIIINKFLYVLVHFIKH